jgi:hypothetical protein
MGQVNGEDLSKKADKKRLLKWGNAWGAEIASAFLSVAAH